MNHKFKGMAGSPAVCTTCHFDVVAHSEFATCDVCKKFPCVVDQYMDSVMCAGCIASENEAAIANKAATIVPEPIARLEEQFIANNGMIAKDDAIADLPMNGNEFFNAEVTSHIALEKKILADDTIAADNKQFFYTRQLQLRQQHLQTALKQAVDIINETRSRLSATQRDINLAATKLRHAEREKLKIADINYIPVAAPKVVKTRTTEKNQVIVNIAKIFCAPRDAKGIIVWDALTDEQREEALVKARVIFSNQMSSINAVTKAMTDDAKQGDKQ